MGTSTTDKAAQRMTALAHANAIRSRRSEAKKDFAKGRNGLREFLTDVPDWARTMTVLEMLMAQRGIGHTRASAICRRLHVRPSVYLANLSSYTRAQLILAVEAVGAHAKRR